MKNLKNFGILSLPLLGLLGCATLNQNQCLSVDWRELGRTDGAAGYEATRLGEHIQACRRFQVYADQSAYRMGREEGLRQYCTPENGMRLGTEGASYRGVCAGENGILFSRYYQRGQTLHNIQHDLDDLSARIQREYEAQEKTKDLEIYKQFQTNIRYLERIKKDLSVIYADSLARVEQNSEPKPYIAQNWLADLPYPNLINPPNKNNK